MRTASHLLVTFLFNAAWQVLLIAALAVLCDRLLQGVDARYRHALWVIALFMSLLLPVLSTSAPTEPRSAPVPVAENMTVPVVVTRISSIDGQEIETAPPKPPPEIISPQSNPPAPLLPIKLSTPVAGALITIYLMLLLYGGARLLQAWRRTRRIVRSAFPVELPDSLQTIIQKCNRAITTRNVRILCSNIPVPITVGIFRPLIILPEPLLREVDEDVLMSAVGHELAHVARYDYLTNLIYEFMYLPIWFHPAASLIRRGIRQTRELCCDQRMAASLLKPEVYARSLLRLIGAAPVAPRLAADTTIGITESDNLEVRIMSLLKTRKISRRRKNFFLLLASLLLAGPCLAATSFALTFEIKGQEPGSSAVQQKEQRQEQIRAELDRKVQELKKQQQLAKPADRAEIEARIAEVQRNLSEHERLMELYRQKDAGAQLEMEKKVQEELQLLEKYRQSSLSQQGRDDELKKIREARQRLAELLTQYPESAQTNQLKKMLEAQQLLEQYRSKLGSDQNTRHARVIHRVEPAYPADARAKNIKGSVVLTMVVDREGKPQDIKVWKSLFPSMDQAAIEAARQMRFEPALKDGQPVPETLLIEFYFALETKHVEVMGYGEGGQGKDARIGKGQGTGQGQGMAYEPAVREMRRSRELDNQQDRERRHAELTQGAVISMDRAIQIATSKYPGKVLACSLGRDKDGPVFYHVVIVSTEGDKATTKYVWVSAVDGTILKTEDESRAASISAGVLNGKAVNLPNPEYPDVARAAGASGSVTVQVTVDEQGNVTSARAASGHPLLQSAAVNAARQAKFKPTYLQGEPVSVRGQLVYNFVVE